MVTADSVVASPSDLAARRSEGCGIAGGLVAGNGALELEDALGDFFNLLARTAVAHGI